MSSKDWEEVKKLAADFQRTQLATSAQRLSDRNCIEIVKKLVELNLIQVIFTCDGKEYLTPDHLMREIEDELVVAGGRVHLTELVETLNVDLSHIEAKAAFLASSSAGEISFVLGQLVNSEYKDRLADEINEKLSRSGFITIGDLTKMYDLPVEFLERVVYCQLGNRIQGIQDGNDSRTIFTEACLNKYKAKIRGILSAVTRPKPLSQIINKHQFSDRIFNASLDALIKDKSIAGVISAGGQRSYIPDIYARTQREWVESFYKQNNYLEYDAMARIGISDPKGYAAKRFDNLIFLKTCCVSDTILYQIDSLIEECIDNKNWIDLQPMLISILDEKDIEQLFAKCVESNSSLETCSLICDTIVVSQEYTESLVQSFEDIMPKKAEQDVKKVEFLKYFGCLHVEKERPIPGEFYKSKKDERKKATNDEQEDSKVEEPKQKEKRGKGKKKNAKNDDWNSGDESKPAQAKVDTVPEADKKSSASDKVGDEKITVDGAIKHSEKVEKAEKDEAPKLSLAEEQEIAFEGVKLSRKEERKKKAAVSQKTGGGTQGREVKMKATKKKYFTQKNSRLDDSDDERSGKQSQTTEPELVFMTVPEVARQIAVFDTTLREAPSELPELLAEQIAPQLNTKYLEVARTVFLVNLAASSEAKQESTEPEPIVDEDN
ncbi:E3 UFM1-protein ligase 1 [Halotydeus destructor]|nr:E3 UFM1-protein ligase 1 [Halotydeus destructor]KAI1303927.1 E3 UFM1-protein ligase 1 [Halotydeus destructor]